MNEEWRDVIGFEQYFRVSNFGEVFSKRTNRMLKATKSPNGYLCISTKIGGRSGTCHMLRVHRLVAEAFLPPPPPDLVEKCASEAHGQVLVRHLDDCKTNNRMSNLAWGSNQDNADDFCRTQKFSALMAAQSGCSNQGAKASPELVAHIRSRYRKGCRTNGARAIGAEFGMHHTNVARIAGGRSYTLDK